MDGAMLDDEIEAFQYGNLAKALADTLEGDSGLLFCLWCGHLGHKIIKSLMY
jgi:hypothetical protein